VSEFEFERGEILTNLTLLEDHADKFQCPFCMEKHLSKVIGYAEEIAMGGEDVEQMKRLAEDARTWRRKIQGAKEHSHSDNPAPRKHQPFAWTECEKQHPEVKRKLRACIKKVEKREGCKPPYDGCPVNPVAVCRASVRCPS